MLESARAYSGAEVRGSRVGGEVEMEAEEACSCCRGAEDGASTEVE